MLLISKERFTKVQHRNFLFWSIGLPFFESKRTKVFNLETMNFLQFLVEYSIFLNKGSSAS